jgi:hypothetical protein
MIISRHPIAEMTLCVIFSITIITGCDKSSESALKQVHSDNPTVIELAPGQELTGIDISTGKFETKESEIEADLWASTSEKDSLKLNEDQVDTFKIYASEPVFFDAKAPENKKKIIYIFIQRN